ncbi:cell division protein FtsW [Eggerthellaceae bacterium zg-1084]|uniref:FtsW/RodA/SpoVE family cell cycle protein n=1 Tax=Berryella wangjianweii TaxID=2734634 RepID=UPI001554BA5D|nr:putative peptidoglycan glycosyltransferase FtsW [Berryella wangjianweii]NPD31448.1 cell division protein FtsW [Berryella wangjianweii]NPD33052.1 cell division protein FtsW [Eggerthellaceae bacterium zg-997]
MRLFEGISREAPEVAGPRIGLLLTTLALTLIGFVMVYSASSVEALSASTPATSYLYDQVKYGVIGAIAGFVMWKAVPFQLWRGPLFYAVWMGSSFLLVLVAVMGSSALGATRWLVLGPISLQPSEFAKFVLVIGVAKLLCDIREGQMEPKVALALFFTVVLLPLGFLYKTQSDLGTSMIIVVGAIATLWLGEVSKRAVGGLLGLAGAFGMLSMALTSYRSSRMLYLNPWNDGADGQGLGYQIIHSFYAFSQGGLFGVGLGNSREKFLYLPESETDFVFSIIGEELGLVGALIVIALFMALLHFSLQVARQAPDLFGTMVAGGLGIMIVFQAFLNMGCAMGVFPTTGKPLPFISSGGSSLISSLMMVGIILSVSRASGEGAAARRRDDLRIMRPVDEAPAPRGASGGRGRAARAAAPAPVRARGYSQGRAVARPQDASRARRR